MSTVSRLTPPLGVFGKFTLKAPWDTATNISYRCVSLRRVEEFVKTGKDIFETVYKPAGLTKAQADADIELGVVIVGLLGTNGSRIFVPDTHVLSYPDQSAVTLSYTVLSIDLGPQPSNMDLTVLSEELALKASEISGVALNKIVVNRHRAMSTTMMSQEEFVNAEDARLNSIANVELTKDIISRQNTIIADQDQLIRELMAQIEEENP